jgi:hypothetical protein
MFHMSSSGHGMEKAKRQLSELPVGLVEAGARGLFRAGLIILGESVLQCPVDTGALRSTAYCSEPERGPFGIKVTLGYGGVPGTQGHTVATSAPRTSKKGHVYQSSAGVDYAIYVHENLEASHLPPTGAKFLERPMVALAPVLVPAEAGIEIDKYLAEKEAE